MCSDTTAMHCSTGQGKLHSPLFKAALQNRLTAGLSHCNYTYGDLLFVQVCSDTTAMHCSTGQINWIPHCSKLLCKTGSQLVWVTAITPMEICCSYRCAVTQQQCTAALGRSTGFPTVQSCSAKQAHSWFGSLQLHLWRFALHTGVQ